MGVVSTHAPLSESFYMKLQQTIAKVEEIKALSEMYEQARQTEAKAKAYADLLIEEGDELADEQKAEIQKSLDEMAKRVAAVTKLLQERTSTDTIDDAMTALDELIVRIEQLHDARRQQLNLRATLDVEMALNLVAPEQRQQAESALGQIQARVEMCVTRIEKLLPGANLVVLG
jgi:hypothetical protein